MMDAAFADVLHRETGRLQAEHPPLAAGLAKAYAIVAGGRLFPEDDGRHAMVRSSDGERWYLVNAACTCKAAQYRKEPCCHRLALRLYQRVSDAMLTDEAEDRWEPATPAPAIPAEHLLMIQGKPFVKFAGLLALAHAQGLVALETTLVQCSLDLAICQATARFQDGRTFTDIGDASPESVAKHLRLAYPRMAATRASARALRRALNVAACSLEELGDEAAA